MPYENQPNDKSKPHAARRPWQERAIPDPKWLAWERHYRPELRSVPDNEMGGSVRHGGRCQQHPFPCRLPLVLAPWFFWSVEDCGDCLIDDARAALLSVVRARAAQ